MGMKNIWQDVAIPIFALAPMEDVTDTVFRRIVASCATPDVMFTEFTNCDGVQSEGRKAVIHRFQFAPVEKPIIAQVWGTNPETYYKTAQEVVAMGFDGIDINMGCPVRDVTSHGACSALINTPALARELIDATKRGVNGAIPVSVKTRIGFKTIQTESWITHILESGIDALTVHGRTAAEMSAVPAHWDEIKKAIDIRNGLGVKTVVIGNGDVQNIADGLVKIAEAGTDGVMIGRGIFEDLWAFDRTDPKPTHSVHEYITVMKKHVQLFESTWGNTKYFPILRKFFKIYVRGFDGASEWRAKVMETKTFAEVYPLIDELLAITN
jgi:nifR3 family TIM-barrel protein